MAKDQKKTLEKKKFSFSRIWADKRLRSIFLSAAVICLCAIVYVVLLLTVLKPEEEVEKPTIGNHGEQMANGKPFVVEPIDEDKLQGIRVDNEFGGFYYYRGDDNKFYFEGAEFMLYDETSDWMTEESENLEDAMSGVPMTGALSSLARYMLATEEVVGYNKDNLAAYGLEDGGKATLEITFLDDEGKSVTQKVIFGSLTLSGSGYYCMLEGRDALYIMTDTYITRCIFTNINAYLSPQVAPPVSSTEYVDVKELSIKKRGQEFLSLRALSEEEIEQNGELFTHVFLNPDGYFPSTDKLQLMLETFTGFRGEAVAEFDIASRLDDPAKKEEMLRIFRLYSLMDQNNNWMFEINYKYEKFDCTLYISEKLEEKNEESEEEKSFIYYVYSPDFDVIVEFGSDELNWVEWDLLTYMDNHSFSVSIDKVASVELKFEKVNARFTLTGTGNTLSVKSANGVGVEADNFRQLYKAILFTTMDGYADKPEDASEILSVTVTLRDGQIYDFDFYGLTARKAYYTLNGSGQFYINRDYVKQMMSACNGILAGEKVTVDYKY